MTALRAIYKISKRQAFEEQVQVKTRISQRTIAHLVARLQSGTYDRGEVGIGG